MSERKKTLLLAAYLFFLCLYLMLAGWETFFMCLCAVLIHESGHLLAARLCGSGVHGLCLSPGGLLLCVDGGSECKATLIYGAGAFFNIVACGVCAAVSRITGESDLPFRLFCANLFSALFNLLPLPYADGDGIAGIWLFRFRSGETVRRLLRGMFGAAFFFAAAAHFLKSGKGFYPFSLSFVLFLTALGGIPERRITLDNGRNT